MRPLPADFAVTREALRTLACYAMAPACKQATGRIGLRPTGDGFGTPEFDDGSRILVRGDRLVRDPGSAVPITTLRDAAKFLDVELSPDPGVGEDLPLFEPDEPLAVDAASSVLLGEWYSFGASVLDELRAALEIAGRVSGAQIWPEHFDLAVDYQPRLGRRANLGWSPGDGFNGQPYVYIGPWDLHALKDGFWNAPFGACLDYSTLMGDSRGHRAAALAFLREGINLLEVG